MAELDSNSTINSLAKEQAGVLDCDFEITDFTYQKSNVLQLIKKHLEATDFSGESVNVHSSPAILYLKTYRVLFALTRMESVM